jgi:hypothetical protein
VAATDSGSIALTVAAVPTGMKAGVSMLPWAVAIRPRRAAPSAARSSKAIMLRRRRGGAEKVEEVWNHR